MRVKWLHNAQSSQPRTNKLLHRPWWISEFSADQLNRKKVLKSIRIQSIWYNRTNYYLIGVNQQGLENDFNQAEDERDKRHKLI